MRLPDRPNIASFRKGGWAIREEALPLVSRWLSGEVPDEQVRAASAGARAGMGSSTVVGGIAVIPLRGVITPAGSFLSLLFGYGGGGLRGFRQCLREALDDEQVSAVLIDIDSPGGLTDLVPETAAEIREARGSKPIVAIANTMAASAAYWLAAQADELVVTPSGDVGSVGVYAVHDDWSKWNADFGIKPTYVKAGKYKAEFNPDEPLSDDAKAHLQETVDAYYAMFVADVAAGRGVDEASVRDGFGEGRMVLAQDAVAAGMADSVETFEQLAARLMGNPASSAGTAAMLAAKLRADEEAAAATRAHLQALEDEPDPGDEPEDEPEPEPEPEAEPDPQADPDEDEDADDDETDPEAEVDEPESEATAVPDERNRHAAELILD
jgi:capsid assembly protease